MLYYKSIKCKKVSLNSFDSEPRYELTALKKQNPLVRAVTTKMTKKMNLNPPTLLWILTADIVSVSSWLSSSVLLEIGTWTTSLGMVTATLGGPSKSFRNAWNDKVSTYTAFSK